MYSQPIRLMKVPQSDVPSAEASRQTKRRWTDTICNIHKQLSLGDSDDQLTTS